ncbi:MAG: trypsin-like peptidase domain-containing protein [Phycisphaerales bacterium]|nr:MAG: trypsin-like peptidase domain-containing protein [Phycisphaerales bacterium]
MDYCRTIALGVVALILATQASVVAQGDQRPRRELRRTPVVEAYERARDSVVNLSTTQKIVVQRWGMNIFGDVFAVPTERSAQSVGSGFVIHEDGYIVTNAHVVSAGARLKVTFVDGAACDGRIIARDIGDDLAVIKVDCGKPLEPISMGRSDDLMIGEQTIAIGNPVGLHNTVTAGVISALHRELEVAGRVLYHDVIQTDAGINPGNSGGPLLNILGELIGINMAIRTDARNIGFAIPVDQLREILPDILDSEKLNKVQVGVRVRTTEPPQVTEVRKGSPADLAGVRLGDVIEAIDGLRIDQGVDFYVSMLDRRPGDVVSLGLVRNGRPVEATMTVTATPRPDGKRLALSRLGITIADVKEKAARRFQWKRQGGPGVIVMAVEPGSPAQRIDIRPGDLLVSMGRYWLTDVDHVGTLLVGVGAGDPVEIGFRRERHGQLYDGEARLYAR